jgi:hypothetical protein
MIQNAGLRSATPSTPAGLAGIASPARSRRRNCRTATAFNGTTSAISPAKAISAPCPPKAPPSQ